MLGPNGALPLHLTDFVRERLLHAGDETMARFLDVLTHRFLLLFYRAWSQGRPTANLDRPKQDRFATYVGALVGIAEPATRARDAVEDHAKLYYAGLLNAQVKREDGLVALLTGYFGLPVAVESFVGHWMPLPVEDRTRLQPRPVALRGAMAGNRLGNGAMLGPRVWDRQHKIRIGLGPLTLRQFETFLPGGGALPKLVALMRLYLDRELEWDAQLVLRADEVPRIGLGRAGRLGYSSWLGRWERPVPARDLVLDAEAVEQRGGIRR
jgi:type VI secretion system protein ImpH